MSPVLSFSQQGAQRGVDCRVRMRSGLSPPDLPGGVRGSPLCLRWERCLGCICNLKGLIDLVTWWSVKLHVHFECLSLQKLTNVTTPDKRASQKIGLRLRNLLKLPKAHKWCIYEWFYSNIDRYVLQIFSVTVCSFYAANIHILKFVISLSIEKWKYCLSSIRHVTTLHFLYK